MDEKQFLEKIIPKIGPANAIQQLNPVELGALIELLKHKKMISKEEMDLFRQGQFKRISEMILALPIPSPIQNARHK